MNIAIAFKTSLKTQNCSLWYTGVLVCIVFHLDSRANYDNSSSLWSPILTSNVVTEESTSIRRWRDFSGHQCPGTGTEGESTLPDGQQRGIYQHKYTEENPRHGDKQSHNSQFRHWLNCCLPVRFWSIIIICTRVCQCQTEKGAASAHVYFVCKGERRTLFCFVVYDKCCHGFTQFN